MFLQEHNLKSKNDINVLTDKFEAYINETLLLKCGTGILIRKNVGIEVINVEYHYNTRIIKMKLKIKDNYTSTTTHQYTIKCYTLFL